MVRKKSIVTSEENQTNSVKIDYSTTILFLELLLFSLSLRLVSLIDNPIKDFKPLNERVSKRIQPKDENLLKYHYSDFFPSRKYLI